MVMLLLWYTVSTWKSYRVGSFLESGTPKGIGAENASLQKLLDLQHWPRYRLGGCTPPRADDPGQSGRAAHTAGLFRLLYLLGIGNDCTIRLSATEALDSKKQRESLTCNQQILGT